MGKEDKWASGQNGQVGIENKWAKRTGGQENKWARGQRGQVGKEDKWASGEEAKRRSEMGLQIR